MTFPLARQRFYREISQPDAQIDLAIAALYIAQEDYPTLDPAVYLKTLDTLAAEVEKHLPVARYPLKVIQIINQYLFDELGFAGNQQDYYDPRNSYLHEVIDRRIGIPITLSLLYLEIAKRVGFPMAGVGMPGHFLICPTVDEMAVFVDPFNRGEVMFAADCESKFRQLYGPEAQWHDDFLSPVSPKPFLVRLLTNLKMIYLNRRQFERSITILDRLLLLYPDTAYEYRDRGLIHYHLKNYTAAKQDLKQYLLASSNPSDTAKIEALLAQIEQESAD
ncbi:MAG: transglutaminase-like domain-containing protein [Cyanobacteria bacterium P01_A01_bin.114]